MIQALGAVAMNSNLQGFFQARVFDGASKSVCVPVLNCYSCPGAVASCPIGSLQAVSADSRFNLSYYVVGLLALFGITMGRWFCGFLCPFGFVQDLLHKIPTRKFLLPTRIHDKLKYLKYVILVVFVFALPVLLTNPYGVGDPSFCKYICPAGTFEGGLPLVGVDRNLQASIGPLFGWKFFLMAFFLIGAVFLYRIFCKYACPLGAIYGIFNPHSMYHLEISDKCISCGKCKEVCKMQVDPKVTPNDPECIRCNDCVHVCPTKAITAGFRRVNDIETPFGKKSVKDGTKNETA